MDTHCSLFPNVSTQRFGVVLTLLLVPFLTGCDSLLDVEPTDQVTAEDLEQPSNASTLVDGAIADYECAHAAYAYYTAILGDEFRADASDAGIEIRTNIRTASPSNWADGDCGTGILGIYGPISTARWSADNALENLEGWTDEQVPNRTELIATAAAYSGYAHLFHAEGMQRAAFDGGPALPPDSVLARADRRFTRAIEAAESAGVTKMLNFALVGRARTRLNQAWDAGTLDDPTALQNAADDARRVPKGFSVEATYSTSSERTENHVYNANGPGVENIGQTIGAPYRNAEFDGVDDPRLPVVEDADGSIGESLPLWIQEKYVSASAAIEIASWEEAKLIVAGAELEAGNLSAAVSIINELHRDVGLPDTYSSSNPDDIRDQIIYERRAELFLEGKLLGDARRYDLPFSPPVGAETGSGLTYGDVRAFPLPNVEVDNNPNID
jgi:hypothetical protein